MADGFVFAYTLDGSTSRAVEYPIKDTVVLSKGQLCNLESGEVDGAATGDSTLVGPAQDDVDNTNDGETVRCIINPGAVYRVTDNNARLAGASLDIATGGLGVTTASNNDLTVVESSTATEPTLVTFNATHFIKR
jgi:hypothetical protein